MQLIWWRAKSWNLGGGGATIRLSVLEFYIVFEDRFPSEEFVQVVQSVVEAMEINWLY